MRQELEERIELFKKSYSIEDTVRARVSEPSMPFYGTEILERAVTALLEGENLLLCGDKLQEKMYWRRIWPGFFRDPSMIFLFM